MSLDKYTVKSSKTIEERIKILIGRNLIVNDLKLLKKYLSTNTSYYHLVGYRFILKNYDQVTDDYNFHMSNELIALCEADKEIASVLIPYIRRIELGLRTRICNLCHSNELVSFYIDIQNNDLILKDNFCIVDDKRKDFIGADKFSQVKYSIYGDIIKNKKEVAIEHFLKEYNGVIPIWVIVNFLSFGSLIKLLTILNKEKLNEFTNNKPFRKAKSLNDPRYYDLLSVRMMRNKISHFVMVLGKRSPFNFSNSVLELGIISISRLIYFLFNENVYDEIYSKILDKLKFINNEYNVNIDIDVIKNKNIEYSLQK